jgi:hypothetical protein
MNQKKKDLKERKLYETLRTTASSALFDGCVDTTKAVVSSALSKASQELSHRDYVMFSS